MGETNGYVAYCPSNMPEAPVFFDLRWDVFRDDFIRVMTDAGIPKDILLQRLDSLH